MDDFWRQVDKTASCWLWTGATDQRYGRFGYGGKKHKAHRFSWAMANGSVPEGLHVLHRCDVPLCVRPDHLFVGTHQDNMEDMFSKGRRRALKGRENAFAKLSDEDVRLLRCLYERGAKQTDLAARFGVHQSTVSKVILGKAWCHAEGKVRTGTRSDRFREMHREGRHIIRRGPKLTAEQVLVIRQEYAAGVRQVDIAAEFNIHQTTVSKIVRRQARRHI